MRKEADERRDFIESKMQNMKNYIKELAEQIDMKDKRKEE